MADDNFDGFDDTQEIIARLESDLVLIKRRVARLHKDTDKRIVDLNEAFQGISDKSKKMMGCITDLKDSCIALESSFKTLMELSRGDITINNDNNNKQDQT